MLQLLGIAFIAQWIELLRPKEEILVRFRVRAPLQNYFWLYCWQQPEHSKGVRPWKSPITRANV